MSKRRECPRCGTNKFEELETYGHCPECLYTEDYTQSFEELLAEAVRAERLIKPADLRHLTKRLKIKICRGAS